MNSSVVQIRTVINEFLQKCLQEKLDKLKEDDVEERQRLLEEYQPKNWVSEIFSKLERIQKVTHVSKYTHPDANGTDICITDNDVIGNCLVSTRTLEGKYVFDTTARINPKTGKANNALVTKNICSFLDLKLDNINLFLLAKENDNSLLEYLSIDIGLTSESLGCISNMTLGEGTPITNHLAKQIYWPTINTEYHLLSPLFPSSLAHHIWSMIREDNRMSKEPRAARKVKKWFANGYREYPNIVIQQFGGTKHQNISKLNTERFGENYLLPSCPPSWKSDPIKPPLRVDSVFGSWFGRQPRVWKLVNELRDYLYSLPDHKKNIHVRKKHAKLVACIVDELLLFAAELRELEGNWSSYEECKLNIDEQCWLNPQRIEFDSDFSAVYTWGDWKENICERFANWLNAQLSKKKKSLSFGEDEAKHWKSVLKDELALLRLEVNSYE